MSLEARAILAFWISEIATVASGDMSSPIATPQMYSTPLGASD